MKTKPKTKTTTKKKGVSRPVVTAPVPRGHDGDPRYAGFYGVIAPLVMCSGVGDGKTTACVMAQAATIDALRKGLTLEEIDVLFDGETHVHQDLDLGSKMGVVP